MAGLRPQSVAGRGALPPGQAAAPPAATRIAAPSHRRKGQLSFPEAGRRGGGGGCSGSSSLQIRLADLGWGEGRASGGHAQGGRCPQPVAEAAGSSNRAKPRLPSPRGEHEVLGVHQRKYRVLLGMLSHQPASSLLPGLSWVGAWPPSRPGTPSASIWELPGERRGAGPTQVWGPPACLSGASPHARSSWPRGIMSEL